MKKIITLLSLVFMLPTFIYANPWGHRYSAVQADQAITVDINTSFTVSVEWGEGDWTSSSFGYGLTTDGTDWTWIGLPWFQDGDGSNKRCKNTLSITTPGKYYYAYRMVKGGNTSYQLGSDSWSENVSTLSASSTISVGEFTVAAGNWSSTSIWYSATVPTSSKNVGIYHNVTLDQDATVGSLTINSGATFTSSDATARILTISNVIYNDIQ